MRFLSFLNDFGLQPNNRSLAENDLSLRQGQRFNDYNRHYTRNEIPFLNRLQSTGIPGVESIKEAMDISSPKVSNRSREIDDISKLEDQFNTLLTKYNATYKLFSESIITTNKTDKDIRQYLGKTITSDDGNYVYINNYGFTHKYSTDAWINNNISCPSNPTTIDGSLYDSFKIGPNMEIGQPCGIAGKNIKNTKTKEYAWVDIKGYKHVYSDNLWKNKSSACELDVISLDNDEYNAIPNGGNMKSTDLCIQLDIDPVLWDQLMKQNNELITISKQLSNKIQHMDKEDKVLQDALSKSQQQLTRTINSIHNDRNQLQYINHNLITINAEQEDTGMNQRMRYLHMLMWFILLITVMSLTVHAFISPQSKKGDTLGIIFAFILLIVIIRWVWNKF